MDEKLRKMEKLFEADLHFLRCEKPIEDIDTILFEYWSIIHSSTYCPSKFLNQGCGVGAGIFNILSGAGAELLMRSEPKKFR